MLATGKIRLPLSGEAGFTLMEALVVVAIVGLLGGLVFPSLERLMGYWEFRSAAGMMESALENSRALALKQDRIVRFQLAPSGQGYAMTGQAPVQLPASTRAALRTGSSLLFFPDGTSSGGAVLLTGAQHRAAFSVSADTGLLRIGL